MSDWRGTKAWLPMDLLLRDPLEVSWFAKCLYARLRRYGWKTGKAFAAVATIADEFHVSTDSVTRATQQLEKFGYLTRKARDGLTNLYEFPRDTNDDQEQPKPRPSKPKRAPKPKPSAPKVEQVELPGVPPPPPPPPKPPREPSEHEVNYGEFQTARRERFEKLGIEFVDDYPYTPAFVAGVMKRLRDECRDDDELFALFDAYLRLDWPADPPRNWPAGETFAPHALRTLRSKNVYPPLLAELRAHAPIAEAH